jgi:hypothetical protein
MALEEGPAAGKAAPRVLAGWREIARYLGMSIRSMQRYEHTCALPVRRPSGNPRGTVTASTEELDCWFRRPAAPSNNLAGITAFPTRSSVSAEGFSAPLNGHIGSANYQG